MVVGGLLATGAGAGALAAGGYAVSILTDKVDVL